jgi:hypothetical protein
LDDGSTGWNEQHRCGARVKGNYLVIIITLTVPVQPCTDLLQGTVSGDKNEILFKRFGINYNNEEEIYKKGSVVYRKVGAPYIQYTIVPTNMSFHSLNLKSLHLFKHPWMRFPLSQNKSSRGPSTIRSRNCVGRLRSLLTMLISSRMSSGRRGLGLFLVTLGDCQLRLQLCSSNAKVEGREVACFWS